MSVFLLPELYSLIANYLTPAEISRCTRVSRLCNENFIPCLWRDVDDRKLKWRSLFCKARLDLDESEEMAAQALIQDEGFISYTLRHWSRDQLEPLFRKYGHHIRTFRANDLITVLLCALSTGANFNKNVAKTETGGKLKSTAIDRGSPSTFLAEGTAPRSGGCSRLVELHIEVPYPSSRGSGDDEMAAAGWKLAQYNLASLRILKMYAAISADISNEARAIMMDALPLMPNLVELQVPFRAHDKHLGHLALRVETLHVRSNPTVLMRVMERSSWKHSMEVMNLTALYLSVSYKTRHIQLILTACPKLQTFGIQSFEEDEEMETEGTSDDEDGSSSDDSNRSSDNETSRVDDAGSSLQLRNRFENLTKFVMGGFHGFTMQLAIVLPWLPNLRQYSAEQIPFDVLQLMVQHCPYMEDLSMGEIPAPFRGLVCGGSPSRHEKSGTGTENRGILNEIMYRIPSLKSITGNSVTVDMGAFGGQPWACQGLQTFRCAAQVSDRDGSGYFLRQGGVIPSETVSNAAEKTDQEKREANKKLEQCREESRERRSILFQQLAGLTQLQVLDLRWTKEFRYEAPVMNLETGLDLLSGLKELREVGVEYAGEVLDQRDLEWMVQNWPKLEVFRGLQCEPWEHGTPWGEDKRVLRQTFKNLRPWIRFL